jgi:hypothetical protein
VSIGKIAPHHSEKEVSEESPLAPAAPLLAAAMFCRPGVPSLLLGWKASLNDATVPLTQRLEGRLVGEEKCERNGNRRRRHPMLALVIILPVVFLVLIPCCLLVIGLGRAAGVEVPSPGDAASIRRPLADDEIAGQLLLFRTRDFMRRHQAGADSARSRIRQPADLC